MVELMYKTMQSSVVKAIQSQGSVIPEENVQPGYFSCYRSTTETTYRTTITGTKSLSVIFVVRPPTTKTTNILPHENYPLYGTYVRT